MACSIRAASLTLRVSGPIWAKSPKGLGGKAGTRPKVGLMPTTPVKPAGIRTDPPPSVPRCSAPMQSAAATADPPLDPPGVFDKSQGLRVMPLSLLSVTPFQPNSGVVVLPRKMTPCSLNLATQGASSVQG